MNSKKPTLQASNHLLLLFVILTTILTLSGQPTVISAQRNDDTTRSKDPIKQPSQQPHPLSNKASRFKRAALTQIDTKRIYFHPNELLSDPVKSIIGHGYHNTIDLGYTIGNLTGSYSDLAQSFTIGRSQLGDPIIGLKISTSQHQNQQPQLQHSIEILKPSICLFGNMHGDETVGRELLLYLATFLLNGYRNKQDPRIQQLIRSSDIYLIPSLNPDGFKVAKPGDCFSAKKDTGRTNANKVDLDKDFPTFKYEKLEDVLVNNKIQQETKQIIHWMINNNRITLSANLRSGVSGITYPYDHALVDSDSKSADNPAPDHELFEYLATSYTESHPQKMFDSKCPLLGGNETIVNGAKFGVQAGTMTDFSYKYTNQFPINLYLNCCKYPQASSLEQEWLGNANSLFSFMQLKSLGFRGIVTDCVTKSPIRNAKVSLDGIAHNTSTTEYGEYWRLATPGRIYDVRAGADGYISKSRSQELSPLPDIRTGYVEPTRIDFCLDPVNFQLPSKPISIVKKLDESINTPFIDNELSSSTILAKNIISLFETSDAELDSLDFLTPTQLDKHHNYTEMVEFLTSLHQQHPSISRLYSIGKSTEKRDLWVFELSDKPGEHQILKPEFKYISNIHGNEVVGKENLLLLAKLLLENYYTNKFVTRLLQSTRIHLMPSMNPDGYEKSKEGDCDSGMGRENAQMQDLNRNFPDQYETNEQNLVAEPEVEAVMKWSSSIPFVLSANFHGGSMVANYPYDGNKAKKDKEYSAAPDDAIFKNLALTYSKSHASMGRGDHCYDACGEELNNLLNEKFPDGITNGAQWYILYGGMQDWNYLHTNCFSITLELGCRKYPFAKDMPKYWEDNKRPMLKYMVEVHRGIYGMIRDDNDMGINNATIHIKDLEHDVTSAKDGDYWRLLLPGEYQVSVSKEGFRTSHRMVTIGKDGAPFKRVDFSLIRGSKDLSSKLPHVVQGENLNYPDAGGKGVESSALQSNVTLSKETKNPKNPTHDHQSDSIFVKNYAKKPNFQPNSEGPVGPRNILNKYDDSKYLFLLCAIIVFPSVLLLVYMYGLTDKNKYHYKLGFSRLPTNNIDDVGEGTQFMRKPGRAASRLSEDIEDGNFSGSEDELYSADAYNNRYS